MLPVNSLETEFANAVSVAMMDKKQVILFINNIIYIYIFIIKRIYLEKF